VLLSDVSVRRPVFAIVVSLLLLCLGVLSFRGLPLREYPNINPPVVSVQTTYPGASANVIETRITQVIENQVSGIEGMKSIRSTSQDERSSIAIEFDLSRNIDEAANDVRDRVARVANELPEEADPPEVAKQDSDARPSMYLNLTSDRMSTMELTDYAERYVIDRFAAISGVAEARISGSGRPAMRIWLDRTALAARELTVSDIENALRRENVELPAGRIESTEMEFQLRIARNYQTADEFRALVVGRGADGHLLRLGEVARVEVGPRSTRSVFRANGQNAVGIGIIKQSTANTLETLEAVKREMARVVAGLPEGMTMVASSDESVFIREAIEAVYETLGIALLLVSLVIFAFLGSLRAMFIPAITIPISLTAAFIALAIFGYSVNLITLLALVLSIGLVVDDAIVVLENVHRRIELGEPPLLAAYNGARQVGFAVVATTIVLVAVFVPIAFLQDQVGRVFAELAVTICAAVLFSSVLALSLTPAMCSKLLKPATQESRFSHWLDARFDRLSRFYSFTLARGLRYPWLAIGAAAGVALLVVWLMEAVPDEYAPSEDQGQFFVRVVADEGIGFDYMTAQMLRLERPLLPLVQSGEIQRSLIGVPGFGTSGTNSGIIIVSLAPWQERQVTTAEVMASMMRDWNDVPGVRAFPFMRSGMSRGGGGQPIQFVLGGSTYEELAQWRDIMLEKIAANPAFVRVDTDLKETQPQVVVRIDKNRAAELGVSVQNIGRSLAAMMSERRVTTYVVDGEEYDVMLQAQEEQRATPTDVSNIYVRSERSGQLIPLANLLITENTAGPAQLNRYNRLRALTITSNLADNYSLGEALDFLDQTARAALPETAQIDYKGESLEYKEASGDLYFTFGIALLIVFLVLAAQFESFVHPSVIMVTVPLAVAGALLGLFLTGKTLNIYSNIGIVMLIGIAAKNGILIVEFINQLRDKGMTFDEAVLEASRIRFRPILMTTVSTAMGALPLIMAVGAGSESRVTLGIVIFSGVTFATMLTLFVVPALYTVIARRTQSPGAVAQKLEVMQAQTGG
jgi:multidrug efflux pump